MSSLLSYDDQALLFMLKAGGIPGFYDPLDLWPVPQSEIDLDKNLTQNPGF